MLKLSFRLRGSTAEDRIASIKGVSSTPALFVDRSVGTIGVTNYEGYDIERKESEEGDRSSDGIETGYEERNVEERKDDCTPKRERPNRL